MSKANWLSVNPNQGSGNGTVTLTGSEHTGRSARSTQVTITAANVEDHYVTVNQAGKAEFVNSQDNASAAKAGATVTITGKSNSSKLTFSLGTGDLNVTLPENYTAAGLSTANGAAIAGDVGASAEYDFSIQFIVASNDTIEEHSKQIIVTDAAGHTTTCLLKQAAGDATLSVSVESLDMDYQGNPVSFTVTANCDWEVK